VWWWLQSLVGHVKPFHVGGLALLPELWCCYAIIQGYILLMPLPLCWTPGMATLSPSTIHSWLGVFEFPYIWNLKKLLGGWRFTPLYCVKGKVKKWFGDQDISFYHQGLKNLIVLHHTYLKKYDDCVEEKGLVLKQLCALLVYTYNHSPKKKRGFSLWLTLVCKTIFSICSCCAVWSMICYNLSKYCTNVFCITKTFV